MQSENPRGEPRIRNNDENNTQDRINGFLVSTILRFFRCLPISHYRLPVSTPPIISQSTDLAPFTCTSRTCNLRNIDSILRKQNFIHVIASRGLQSNFTSRPWFLSPLPYWHSWCLVWTRISSKCHNRRIPPNEGEYAALTKGMKGKN